MAVPSVARRASSRVGRISLAKLLSVGIWMLGVGGLIVTLVLWSRQRFADPTVTFVTGPVLVGEMIVALAYASVGWLLASVRSGNPIGWLFLGMGTVTAIQLPVILLAGDAGQAPDAVPAGALIGAWLASSAHLPFVGTLGILAFLVFPDGRFVGRRWALAAWSAAIGAVAVSFAMALSPGRLLWYPTLANPYAAPAWTTPLLWTIGVAGGVLFVSGLLAAGLSMVVRYQRATQRGRLQLRWIAFAVVLLTLTAAPFLTVRYVMEVPYEVASLLAAGLVMAAGALPLAAAIAVLRYRLLDIDLIINRTLVYVSLSAILGGLLAASSAVSQRIFVALTGDTSDIAIVLATLVVAGAFTPIQRAVQGVADRYVKPAGAATADAAPIPPAASAPATAASPPSALEGAAPAELNVMLRPILARLDQLEGRIAEVEPKRPAPRSPSAPPPGEAT